MFLYSLLVWLQVTICRDLLQYNDEMWLGMNKENDFIGHRPEAGVFGESQIFFPGTAFNLNFILFGRKHDGTSY